MRVMRACRESMEDLGAWCWGMVDDGFGYGYGFDEWADVQEDISSKGGEMVRTKGLE